MVIKWMFLEVLLCNKYSIKGDVWTFGIVLVEIYFMVIFNFEKKNYKKLIENFL